eukprot:TRINITY_DN1738_c0_g1_i2.p1 TRINITY_DN1738_c0_g1~~TRINITY_DN1738_c0_g1_i2.p1  ORF type:complete len:354 (-),score=18.38 TRINITY_DN1738_c0_g1_i2:645-1706(-)
MSLAIRRQLFAFLPRSSVRRFSTNQGYPPLPHLGLNQLERAKILKEESLLYWGNPGEYSVTDANDNAKIQEFQKRFQRVRSGTWKVDQNSIEGKNFEVEKSLAGATYIRALIRCPKLTFGTQDGQYPVAFLNTEGKKVWPMFTSEELCQRFLKDTGRVDLPLTSIPGGWVASGFAHGGVWPRTDLVMIDPSADFSTHWGRLDQQMTALAGVQLTSLTALKLMETYGANDATLQKINVFVFVSLPSNQVYISGGAQDAMYLQVFISDVHRTAALHELSENSRYKSHTWQMRGMTFSQLLANFNGLPKSVIGFTIDRLPASYNYLAGRDYAKEKRDVILHSNQPRINPDPGYRSV